MFIQSRKNKGELRKKLIEVFLGWSLVDVRLVLLMRMVDNCSTDYKTKIPG